jgi:hypothetical protein
MMKSEYMERYWSLAKIEAYNKRHQCPPWTEHDEVREHDKKASEVFGRPEAAWRNFAGRGEAPASPAARRHPRHDEDDLQAAIVRYSRLQFPEYLIFAVPNGAARSKITAAILKHTGTLAGVSDLIVVLPFRVLFIEVKTATGRQSESQKTFQMAVESLGHIYHIARSIEQYIAIIKKEIRNLT